MKFSDGHECPIIGIGTWKSKPGEVTQAIKDAIDVGYQYIDCALVYGNEKEVGEAIIAKIAEGKVKREDLFITSKLWNTFHRPDLVKGVLQQSLMNLNLKFLDLYLIHWPQAYKAMEPLRAEGLVKSFGISNFNAQQMERLMKQATVKPVVNQVVCHPYLTQKQLQEVCKKPGVALEAYSPLGSPDWPWAKPDDLRLLYDKRLLAVAQKFRRSVGQFLIRYQIERGHVVIPKSVTKSRIAENFDGVPLRAC